MNFFVSIAMIYFSNHEKIIVSDFRFFIIIIIIYRCVFEGMNYASPTSGEAYRDRQLTTNFELWVEIFCVDMFPYEDSKTVSVRLSAPREKKSSFLASSISVLH